MVIWEAKDIIKPTDYNSAWKVFLFFGCEVVRVLEGKQSLNLHCCFLLHLELRLACASTTHCAVACYLTGIDCLTPGAALLKQKQQTVATIPHVNVCSNKFGYLYTYIYRPVDKGMPYLLFHGLLDFLAWSMKGGFCSFPAHGLRDVRFDAMEAQCDAPAAH